MPKEKWNQEFRLNKTDQIINYLIEEITLNDLISKKHKKVCRVLNYFEHWLIVIATTTGCFFYFCFCFFSWNL